MIIDFILDLLHGTTKVARADSPNTVNYLLFVSLVLASPTSLGKFVHPIFFFWLTQLVQWPHEKLAYMHLIFLMYLFYKKIYVFHLYCKELTHWLWKTFALLSGGTCFHKNQVQLKA